MNKRQRISDFQHHVNGQAAAIRLAGDDAWKNIDLNQAEPQIVYDFLRSTKGGTGHLNRALGTLLSTGGRTVKFASIFLHQKPMVRGLNGKKQIGGVCELGDLQLLFLYVSADKSLVQCRSSIIQAKKKTSAGSYVISHEDQRRLYDKCSGFVYSSVLKDEKRHLPWGIAEREKALQYLFVGSLPVKARLIPSDINQGAFLDFGELILRFLNDSMGYAVTAKPSAGKNWSRIVWDQIDNVAKTAFGHQGDRNEALESILNQFNSFDDPKEFFLDVPPSEASQLPGGIPMLLVIVSDSQLGREQIVQSKLNQQSTNETLTPKTLSPVRVTVKVKHQVPDNERGLQSANISDLVIDLESSAKGKQHQIIVEFERRSRIGGLLECDHAKILTVINRLHDIAPKTKIKIYQLQQTLRSKATEKVKVYLGS